MEKYSAELLDVKHTVATKEAFISTLETALERTKIDLQEAFQNAQLFETCTANKEADQMQLISDQKERISYLEEEKQELEELLLEQEKEREM